MPLTQGLRYMAYGAFWFSVMGLCVKVAGRRLPSQELVLVRAVLTLALSWASLRRAGLPLRGANPRLLVLRGLFGCLGLTAFYYSITHLPLGEAVLFQHTNPVWSALLAALLLGERVGRRELACLALGIVGVAVAVRPASLLGGAPALPPFAVAVALGGALASAGAYLTIRRMGRGEDPRRVTTWLPLVTVPITLPFALGGWIWPTPREWAVLVAMAVSTQIAQVYMTLGLQRETAARATGVGYLQLAFAGVWGWLLFGERPTAWTAAGAALVVTGTLALVVRPPRPGAPPAPAHPAAGVAREES